MFTRIIIIPYKMGSKSAKALKECLVNKGIRCFRKKTTDPFLPKRKDLLLYYGGNDLIQESKEGCLNYTRQLAQNKLTAFQTLQAAKIQTVEWTTDVTIAQQWPCIVARATLTGHSGQGIIIYDQGQPLPIVPLYTKYTKKTYECRIHVFQGKVIDAQIKRKTRDYNGETNTLIRNIHTGWVYCREDFTPTEECKTLAISAVAALQLDFGAVDIIYNQHHNQNYVLEVNTAPGLEGTTLINYVEAINNVINS